MKSAPPYPITPDAPLDTTAEQSWKMDSEMVREPLAYTAPPFCELHNEKKHQDKVMSLVEKTAPPPPALA
jgi:hypothetical protein